MHLLLPRLVSEAAERDAGALAVAMDGATLDYGGLERRTNRFARSLVAHGVRRGDRVGLWLPKWPDAVVALYGIIRPFYERVVQAAVKWNVKKNIVLVVGATHPNEPQPIRKLAPGLPILIPGIGKQGGDLESAVRFGSDNSGRLAIINASRSVLYASSGKDFALAARSEALQLRDQIQKLRDQFFS